MVPNKKQNLRERVAEVAEQCIGAEDAVGILDVFMGLGFLHPSHFEAWKKGMQYIPVLDDWIQCGEKKRNLATEYFLAWVHEQTLEPFEITYEKNVRQGTRPLRLTHGNDESCESLYRTKFRRAGLTVGQEERIEKKSNRIPDLLVYAHSRSESKCSECGSSLEGELLYLENGNALCIDCADMAHLVFLPRGNATLTRRAKKFSSLSAIVLRFNRRRRRYERQGTLVTSEAIEQAEASCEADSDQRAKQRQRSAARSARFDAKLVEEMAELILTNYPSCPTSEAKQIATHTAERGSGRVGRSAAGRALSPDAINLAVRAWIRHQHTNYDSLLMQGVERQLARQQIADAVNSKTQEWEADPSSH